MNIPPFVRKRRGYMLKGGRKELLKLTSLKIVFVEEDTAWTIYLVIEVMISDYNIIITCFKWKVNANFGKI